MRENGKRRSLLFFFDERGKSMKKIKKRLLRPVCALLLCLTLSAGSAYTSYAAMPGVFLGAEEALASVLMMLGISAASDGAYSSADALAEWGGEQIDGLVQHISTSQKYAETLGKLGTDALKAKVTEWATKAGRGVIETASDVWGALKDWAGSLHKGIRADSGSGYFPAAAGYGGFVSVPVGEKVAVGYYHDSAYSAGGNIYKFLSSGVMGAIMVKYSGDMVSNRDAIFISNSPIVYQIAQYSNSGDEHWGAEQTVSSKYYGYYVVTSGMAGFNVDFYKGFSFVSSGLPLYDMSGLTSRTDYFIRHVLGLDPVESFPASTNKSVGGVGDIYERDGSLDNVGLTGVGVGTKVGDVPIDWAAWGEIAGTLEGVRTGVLDIADVMAGSKVWAYDTTRDTVIDSDKDLDNDIPIADVVPGANVSDYTITGLQDVFPFCIPFDLIDFLSVLDAEPEAPRFEWEFEYAKGKVYKFDLDLSRFETVAAAFRTFELLGFCLALILITRDKMIKG